MSSFLGRTEEVAELSDLLERERLVTLTGAPGIGKTRLALELGAQLGGGYRGGARIVELAGTARAAHVPRAVASALSLDEQPGQKITDTIIARLQGRRVLVVLDNCEHLLGGCAKLADALLSSCPQLRMIATSREPLALEAERVWQVPPLEVPAAGEALALKTLGAYAAVGLFLERARAIQPGFSLNAYVAPAVVEICRRLDGIPLAIELAAACVESVTPAEIARRLDDRFDLLTKGGGGEPARQQTLDWSHELLAGPERALLRRLSVFVGRFELEAAVGVCAGGELSGGQVGEMLAALVAKSLVVAEANDSPTTRYRLLETIRAYAAERLEQAGERAKLRSAHARFYLALAEQAEPELTGAHQQQWLAHLEAERANLRSGIEWSLSQGETEQALRLAGALVLYWRVRCHFSEGRELLDAAVAVSDGAPGTLRAKALWGAGFMELMLGDIDRAVPLVEESLRSFRELDDRQGCARALLILGNCKQFRDDPTAPSLLGDSADLARQAGDPWCLAHALGVAGLEYAHRDDLTAARPLFEECLLVAREAEDKQGLRLALIGLGSVTLRQGDYGMAEAVLEEAVVVADELGEDYAKATALNYLGHLASARGDYVAARGLLEEALACGREVGSPPPISFSLVALAEVARFEGDRRRARLLFEEALALAPAGSDANPSLRGLAELAAENGELDRARRLFEEALGLARAHENKGATAQALHGLGQLARVEGEGKRAAVLLHEALQLQSEIGTTPGVAVSLEAVAGLSAALGRYRHAARLLGASQALRDASGFAARSPGQSARFHADLALVRQALRPEEFEAAFAQGAALSLTKAVAEAPKDTSRRERPASGWLSLTEREQEVAAMAAEGLTNPVIAERLFISPQTVKTHLSHIFKKLGVVGRRELAAEVRRGEQEPFGTDR